MKQFGVRYCENGDYGSQDVNHSNMRWLGRITTEENLEIRKTQVNKCKRNKNEKYKNDLRYFDK